MAEQSTDGHQALERLARHFQRFAEYETRGYSPLYEKLCLGIAADAAVLEVALATRTGQPEPNMLLGAVHYLILRGADDPLADYYASVTDSPLTPEDAYEAFRTFVLSHRPSVERLLRTRLVQTNEVGRSACLMPAFAVVQARAGGRPLALVEVGASAGLNLLFDRFFYDYGVLTVGDLESPVCVRVTLEGEAQPPVERGIPRVDYRVGVDLNPIDVSDPDEAVWLRALVWPEHEDRARLLESAIGQALRAPPKLVRANALDVLPALLDEAPADLALCVFQSFVLQQLTKVQYERFLQVLADAARRRPLHFISMQSDWGLKAYVELMTPESGDWRRERLLESHPHGHWLRWLGPRV